MHELQVQLRADQARARESVKGDVDTAYARGLQEGYAHGPAQTPGRQPAVDRPDYHRHDAGRDHKRDKERRRSKSSHRDARRHDKSRNSSRRRRKDRRRSRSPRSERSRRQSRGRRDRRRARSPERPARVPPAPPGALPDPPAFPPTPGAASTGLHIPGLTHSFLAGNAVGRHTGLSGGMRPTFRTADLNKWVEQQLHKANADREEITRQLKADRRRRKGKKDKRKRKKKHRRGSSSSSTTSTSSSSADGLNALGDDDHDFRRLGREHPGVTFASVVADTRAQLGQLGFDHDIGAAGPVFWKWYDAVLPQKAPAATVKALREGGEMFMLICALDEFRQGRFLEVADILASRLRALGYHAEGGPWKIAREYLTYVEQAHSLVSNATEDAAAKLVERQARRANKMARHSSR